MIQQGLYAENVGKSVEITEISIVFFPPATNILSGAAENSQLNAFHTTENFVYLSLLPKLVFTRQWRSRVNKETRGGKAPNIIYYLTSVVR